MFSIIIPLYNKESQILSTLNSVFSQTYRDFEVVIVNDGSTDSSVEKVNDFIRNHPSEKGYPSVRLINQSNGGVSKARNTGIENAIGEYVAFLDADDEWKPQYLQTQSDLIKKYPQASVFATNYEFKDENGNINPTILRKLPFEGQDGIISNYFQVASCSHPPLWTSAIVAKKSALQAVDGFPLGIASGEDLLTWAKLAVNYKIAFTYNPETIYNLGEGYNFSNLPPRRQDAGDPVGKELKKLYYKHKNLPGFKRYLSHWHKMRVSVAVRYNDRREVVKEIVLSLKYNFFNYKVYPFILFLFSPYRLNKKIFSLKK